MATSRKKEKHLAKANGFEQELYVDRVNERVKKSFRSEEETAITRKAIALILELIKTLHPDAVNDERYKQAMEWNAAVELIKSEVEEELK